MALRTVIYTRKSSKDKDERHQKYSLPRQRREIIEYLERYNKVQDVEEQLLFDEEKDIVAEDASAKIVGNRPKFAEMVEKIKKGRYDVLFCTELSRLSRNAVDSGTLVQLLEDGHLQKIQTKDKVFTTTPTDKFTLALFLSVSKFENDQRAVNTSSGLANQKSRGVTTHKAPLGYLNKGTDKNNRWVEIDPLSWEKVQTLWHLFLTGDYHIADIKREADKLGVTGMRSGKRFIPTETTYRGMFQNRYYTGYVSLKNTETGEIKWIEGEHKKIAMISTEEFERAQLLLQSRGYRHQNIVQSLSIESVLNEVLLCGKCETDIEGMQKPTKMSFEQKVRYTCGECKHRFASASGKLCPNCNSPIDEKTKKDVNRYYRCCKRHSSLACSHDFYGKGKSTKNLQAERIEQYLDAAISKLYISDDLFEVLRRQLYTLWLKNNNVIRGKINALEKQKKDLQTKRLQMKKNDLERITELSDVDREENQYVIEQNRNEEQDLKERIAELEEQEEEKFEKAWQTLQALRQAKSVFASDALELEPKRKLVLSMISNLTITDEKWIINWKKPFDVVAKASIAKRGRPKSGTTLVGDEKSWLHESNAIITLILDNGYWKRIAVHLRIIHSMLNANETRNPFTLQLS